MGRSASRVRRYRWFTLPVIIVVALVATLAFQALTHRTAITAQRPQLKVIYLPDPADPILDVDVARAWGVQVVPSAAELTSVAMRSDVDAVLLDQSTLDLVSAGWLTGQLQQGRVVVGLNVPINRLVQVPGYNRGQGIGTGNYAQDWGGQPFYSWIHQQQQGGRITHEGHASERIYSPEGLLSLLHFKIQAIHAARDRSAPPRDIPPRPTRTR